MGTCQLSMSDGGDGESETRTEEGSARIVVQNLLLKRGLL